MCQSLLQSVVKCSSPVSLPVFKSQSLKAVCTVGNAWNSVPVKYSLLVNGLDVYSDVVDIFLVAVCVQLVSCSGFHHVILPMKLAN